ncbi:spore germination protein [Paenibacillus sp. 1781tsa1]|uniref:spore germination protein n=1 Tax=Paenibacillus sp. 1781tsa1 TaxID=2953810 RepID=UPI0020A0ABE4|nr:spore germination protein [Paenibacillus sp. 1781tsa1]MCP1187494.1 spore germination protein [Paenibacillus sp. 1781tsa1]
MVEQYGPQMNNHHMSKWLDELKEKLNHMDDAEVVEHRMGPSASVHLLYIKTLINQERLNEAIIQPLQQSAGNSLSSCLTNSKLSEVISIEDAEQKIMQGFILLNDSVNNQWLSVQLENPLGRAVEPSETETVIYGAKDSFSEQIDKNITMLRRRLPITTLKTESFTIGSLSKTKVVLMYIDGLTNPEFVSLARDKINSVNFDQFLDSSQLAAFIEDHNHTVFPQFLQTDRPDACAYALGEGKLTILVSNSPFALVCPITLFHLFQSPEDYFLRWPIASFLRLIRYGSFIVSLTMIPFYVALTTFHYQMVPLPILFVLLESRSKLPFTPFVEGLFMIVTLEIIKEASLRMPTKTSQTLGVIGGIVIGQAAVEAGFASKVLIVLMGISAIAFFLVPNYQMTKSMVLLQVVLLILASFLGLPGIVIGLIGILAHLHGLTSLGQPFLAPISPFHGKDWIDLFIRGPLIWMKTRPKYLKPLRKSRKEMKK